MQDRPITDIVRHVRLLLPTDPVARAVSLMRAAGIPELPVVNYGRVVGLVHESDLLPLLASEDGGDQPVVKVMRTEPLLANRFMTLGQVIDIFSSGKMAVLPVVDEYGAYVGILARADVAALLGRVLRPQTVGGMATPLGVHLTTGTVSAGPGSPGLFLAGVALAMLFFAGSALAYGLAYCLQLATKLPIIQMLESPILGQFTPLDIPTYSFTVLQFVLMMLLMRLSPLAGYHAAEHMVVHTIEAGEQLVPEVVKQMPRVHPRCGTNLLVASTIFIVVATSFSGVVALYLALIILVLGWRNLGGMMQHYVTTRPPSDKQLANGIKVGAEILDKFQEKPNLQVSNFQRIWNVGMLQTFGGMMLTMYLTTLLGEALGLPLILFGGM